MTDHGPVTVSANYYDSSLSSHPNYTRSYNAKYDDTDGCIRTGLGHFGWISMENQVTLNPGVYRVSIRYSLINNTSDHLDKAPEIRVRLETSDYASADSFQERGAMTASGDGDSYAPKNFYLTVPSTTQSTANIFIELVDNNEFGDTVSLLDPRWVLEVQKIRIDKID